MAVVDGPFNFMGYTDNGESPPTDSDQPCSSSSYKPTPTSVSTEAVTLINNSTEGPKAKKTRVTKKVTVVTTGSRLPEPCPLPIFSERTKEIISSGIKGNDRFFLLREAVIFYEGICPHPSHTKFALCLQLPSRKSIHSSGIKNGYVKVCMFSSHSNRAFTLWLYSNKTVFLLYTATLHGCRHFMYAHVHFHRWKLNFV